MRFPGELRSPTLLHLVAIVAVLVVFTALFSVVEGWPLVESVYFVVLLMTLAGASVNPLTPAGLVLASVLAIVSIVIIVSFLAQVLGPLTLSAYEALRLRRLRRMQNHIVMCGYSDTAKVLAGRIPKGELLVVVKDRDASDHLAGRGITVVQGDYTTSEVLRRAGVAESRAVIAVSAVDSENAFVCLTVKKIAPRVPVIATVSSEENQEKLEEVGADTIVSPALLSATSILQSIAPARAPPP